MGHSQFWHLGSPESTARLARWAEDMDYESTVFCPVNDGHQRAGKRLPELSIVLTRQGIQDFVWTWHNECLLQDSVLELFKRSGFTGFAVKPVKARFKRACFDDGNLVLAVRLMQILPMGTLLGGDDFFKIALAGGREVTVPSSIGKAIHDMTPAVQEEFETALSKATSAKKAQTVLADFTGLVAESRQLLSQVKAIMDQPQPPRLSELVVTGWGGMAPPESGIKLIERCEGCSHYVYSAWSNPQNLIDSSQWDGSDFFVVWPLPSHIFVTECVVRVIRDNRLSGIVLKPSGDLVFPPETIPTLSTGRLSDWMPPERARELGAALGID